MIKAKNLQVLIIFSALSILAGSAFADVPKVISYQGRLTDVDGNPVADGDYDLTFQIVEHDPLPMPESPLWSSGVQTVTVTDGLFEYYLGSNVPLPTEIFNDDGLDSYYLRIRVEGSMLFMSGTEMVTAPFAVRSIYSDTATYALAGPGGGASGWVDDGTVVRLATSSDRVGIGTSSPSEPLVVGRDLGYFGQKYIVSGSYALDDVCGIKMGYSGDEHTTLEWAWDGPSFAIHTKRSGINYANTFVVNDGIVGINNAYPVEPLTIGPSLGTAYGDMISICNNGASNKYSGIMFGEDVQNKATIFWYNGSNEMRLQTESDDIVYSKTLVLKDGNVGFGISPDSNKTIHIADTINLTGSTETNHAVYADVHNEGVGLLHSAGYFKATGPFARGIYVVAGESAGSFGVAGDFTSLNGDGIRASGTQYAGNFNGDVDISGNLSKSSGSFRIDHPLDPENKYLQHSFVESPDMMNIYNGNVVLDINGRARVELPDYFTALNKDFRYQLTAVGAPAPNLHIAEKISENQFVISGGEPGMEVSWQITGVRHDPWANEHRIQVEVDKPEDENGLYRHPKVYGFGEERGIDFRLREDIRKSLDK